METEQRRPVVDREERLEMSLLVTALIIHALLLRLFISESTFHKKKTTKRRSKIELEITRRNFPSSSPCLII